MKTTAPPTITNRAMRPSVAMRAGMLMKRADDRRAERSSGGGGLPARTLPASEACEHVSQGRQRGVDRRLLLVVDHEQALGLEAEPRRHVPDRLLHGLR